MGRWFPTQGRLAPGGSVGGSRSLKWERLHGALARTHSCRCARASACSCSGRPRRPSPSAQEAPGTRHPGALGRCARTRGCSTGPGRDMPRRRGRSRSVEQGATLSAPGEEPRWVTRTAERLGALRTEEDDTLARRKKAWEEHIRKGGPPVLAPELERDRLAQWANWELGEIRKSLALTPAGYEPYRHTMIIEGRPVQARATGDLDATGTRPGPFCRAREIFRGFRFCTPSVFEGSVHVVLPAPSPIRSLSHLSRPCRFSCPPPHPAQHSLSFPHPFRLVPVVPALSQGSHRSGQASKQLMFESCPAENRMVPPCSPGCFFGTFACVSFGGACPAVMCCLKCAPPPRSTG